jgi:hypothetical protein
MDECREEGERVALVPSGTSENDIIPIPHSPLTPHTDISGSKNETAFFSHHRRPDHPHQQLAARLSTSIMQLTDAREVIKSLRELRCLWCSFED